MTKVRKKNHTAVNSKKIIKNTLNILLPILLGVAILWWMYKGFDFSRVADTLLHGTNWWWMAFSLVFGVTAQVFRGLRWKQTLAPLGEHPSTADCIHAIFISYTTSLIIPRSGEMVRCGILSKYDGTSFSKSLGTVVAERAIDSLLLLFLAVLVFFLQIDLFMSFLDATGTSFSDALVHMNALGYIIVAVCTIVLIGLFWILVKRFEIFARLVKIFNNIKDGVFSLKDVSNKWLFVAYTIGIWGSYFLHFYTTFFCFEFTKDLGIDVAIAAFIVGSFAVIVPTPNGMGSWHFAVKTVLLLSGVKSAANAETFALIVHAIQTALMPVLGIYSTIALLQKGGRHKQTDHNQ